LTLSISPRDMPTRTALLTGVLRVDQHDRNACELRFVLDKEAQLGEGPAGHPGALRLPKPGPLADVLKIFQGDAAFGALGRRNERFAHDVVRVSAKPCFPSGVALQRASNVLGAFAAHLGDMCGPLQPLTVLGIPRATGFNVFAAVRGAVRGRCQIDDPQVDPEKICWRDRRPIRHLNHDQQKPLAIFTHHEMALPWLVGIEALLVVGTNQERHQDTPLQCQQADVVEPVKPHDPLVIRHRRVRTEGRADRLVPSIGPSNPGQAPYRHLRREIKPRPQLVVVQALQGQFVADLFGKCLFGQPITRVVKARHHGTQGGSLVVSREEFELQGQFHEKHISTFVSNIQG